MDMIKLIVTDVDGTLLDNNSKLSSLNKKAIFESRKKGIEVILSTGKSICSILYLIKLFGLKLPQITLNGAVIIDKNLEIINAVKLEPRYYLQAIKTIKRKGYFPLVALINGKIFYEKYHPSMDHIIKVEQKITKTEDIGTGYFSSNAANIHIAIEETDPLDSYLRKKFSGKINFIRSGKYYFDMLNPDASKGNALVIILKKFNITKNEVVVFGDSYNDLSMFKESGLNIAVRNSYPEVLKQADIIAEENNDSGLGKAIYKYILGGQGR
jgi:Cof subfamily protein (haloacid dehalogenase superfamily)